MSVYHVYLRKGGSVAVTAAGFVEAKREGRIYFFDDAKQKEDRTFFYLRDVAGVHAPEKKTQVFTVDALRKRLKSHATSDAPKA